MPGFGVRLALPSLVLVSELGKVFALFINKHPWFLNKIYFYLKLSARVFVSNSIFVILSHIALCSKIEVVRSRND